MPAATVFQRLSIRGKILATSLLACLLALGLAGIAFIAIETAAVRHMLEEDLDAQAELMARNCRAAIAFDDSAAAEDILRSLAAKENIVGAWIFTAENRVLAAYRNAGDSAATRLLAQALESDQRHGNMGSTKLLDGFSRVQRTVSVDGETLGTVVLVSNLAPLYQRLGNYIFNSLMVVLMAGGIAYLLCRRMAGQIAQPVHDLAATMTRVSADKNYALRAVKTSNDEVGTLIDQFNTMLGRIEERDELLRERGQTLEQMAHYDSLTGLPNRLLIIDRLGQAINHAANNDEKVAVLFIDLDHFKDINDSLGHRVGDLLLKEVGIRLKESIRGSDNVGRLGGDEFVIFLHENKLIENVVIMVQRLIDGFAKPFSVEGNEIFTSASIGVTFFPMDGNTVDALLKNADTAMYSVKESGKNHYQFFSPDMQLRASQRLDLHNGLRRALERQEFFLLYQPAIDLATGRVCGFEALLRWNCPERGTVPPLEFIPLAEETGLIVPIGDWVLRTVCRQIRNWQDAGLNPPRVAVNISPVQLRKQNLADTVSSILAETGIAPDALGMEITESFIISSDEAAIDALWSLKRMGVRISIDDFGTGYSSLNYLRRIPLDALKIDRSFIANSLASKEDAVVIKAILGIGQNLALRIVGEGVETEEQLDFLKSQGCHEVQGYLFSRPVPPEQCLLLPDSTSLLPATGTT